MQNSTDEPHDHEHRWVNAINGIFSICQICQWRKSHLDGQIYPPDPQASNPALTD